MRKYLGHDFEIHSAGTEPKDQVHPLAVKACPSTIQRWPKARGTRCCRSSGRVRDEIDRAMHLATREATQVKAAMIAEAFGTFCLVLAGTGAIIVNDVTGGVITHPGIALSFGLVIMAMIYAVGDASGAHLNPAVTLGFALAGRLERRRVPGLIAAQVVGAMCASGLLRVLFPDHDTLGTTLPTGTPWRSFVLEIVLTLILMFVILRVSTGSKELGLMAGIAVGGTVGLEAMFAGPITGASMNPARSLAPALVSGTLSHLWVYLAAPIIGATLAVPLWSAIRPKSAPPAQRLQVREEVAV